MESEEETLPDSKYNNEPFVKFLRDLHRYAERPIQRDNFDVKRHITSFTVLYNQYENKDDLCLLISKTSGLITRLYSKLSEYMYENERHYIQEFYFHWKQILCHMKPKKRSKSCERSLRQMGISLGHLRSARNRMEQVSILDVLFLYVKNATLKDNQFDQINGLREIARMAKIKSHKAIHNFLSYINLDEDNIFTIKPTCVHAVNVPLKPLEQNSHNQEVWLDFNLKEASIAFVAYSSISEELLCSGIASYPQLQEYLLNGEYLLLSSGWTLSLIDGIRKPNEAPKLVFTCLATEEIKVNSLKGRFDITEYLDYDVAADEKLSTTFSSSRSY